jgi:hypothetical protein
VSLGEFFIYQQVDFCGFSETGNYSFEFFFVGLSDFVLGEAVLVVEVDGDGAVFEGVEFVLMEDFEEFALVGVIGFDFGGGSLV